MLIAESEKKNKFGCRNVQVLLTTLSFNKFLLHRTVIDKAT
jgi:hypothetical protein